MFVGVGRTRRVLLTDTLLDKFTDDEIELSVAHTVGHIVFRHTRRLLVLGMLFSMIGFWICDRLLAAFVAESGGGLDYGICPDGRCPASC